MIAGLALIAPTDHVLARWPTWQAQLTPVELARATAFRHDTSRRDFAAAHLLVRECAAAVVGVSASALTVEQLCARCGGPHGAPRLIEQPGVFVSMSHTRGAVAAVASGSPCGIDIEQIRATDPDDSVLHMTLTPDERAAVSAAPDRPRAFVQYWVRKEAALKREGLAIGDFATIESAQVPILETAADFRVSHAPWRGVSLTDFCWPSASVVGAVCAAAPIDVRMETMPKRLAFEQ